ncbi:hypothetical protein KR018_004953 [Drosophila ironensis]|nr:hypothetical protein KR018_004953 [Drosophila ironensis]
MKMNLEGNLITVNKKFVNIDDHREEFTKHYDALRTMLYIKLQKCNPVLEKLLKGHTLGGSYGDNLKVAMPNEFDLVLHLIFPENDKIIVKADRKKPGNVTLDMSKVMEIIGNQEHNKSVFQQLQKMVTKNQMLCEDKLQSWLQGVMTKALNNFQIQVGTETSSLCYKRCGPAHTIFVTGRYEYSVDFVPAIRLKATQAVLPTSQQRYFQGTPHWDAIPKPINAENISFRASYYDAEKKILHNRNNLKNAIRLMKQLRDTKNNMANLKSYYIKTLFLWESVQQPITYWDNSVSQIVIQMMEKLRITFKPMGKLKFFWDPELNMIADLTDNQRKAIYQCVVGSQKTFFWGDGDLTGATVNKVHSLFGKKLKTKCCSTCKYTLY